LLKAKVAPCPPYLDEIVHLADLNNLCEAKRNFEKLNNILKHFLERYIKKI